MSAKAKDHGSCVHLTGRFFFYPLLQVYSSLGIFSLSFAVPVYLWMIYKGRRMSFAERLLHGSLILLALTGCGLGMWAAIRDIQNKWSDCDYKI